MSDPIAFHLPDEQLQQLDEIAKRSKKLKNRTDVIHEAIKQFIANEKEGFDKRGRL